MRRPLWLLLSALLAFLSAPARAERPVVVVFDLENRGAKLPAAVVGTLSDYIATRLAEDGYQIVPRAEMKAALRSQKKASYRACYEESCQIELGRELAAEKTLASQVARVGRTCLVTLKLYDLRKSAAEAAGSARGKCSQDGVLESIDAALTKLSAGPSASAERPAPARAAPSEILVIEFDKAVQAKPGYERARRSLKLEKDRMQARLDTKRKALETLKAKTLRATGSKQKRLQKELQKGIRAFSAEARSMQESLRQQERQKVGRLTTGMQVAVGAAARPRGSRLVLPARNVLYRDPRLDCPADLSAKGCRSPGEVRVAVVDFRRLLEKHPDARKMKTDLQRRVRGKEREIRAAEASARQICRVGTGDRCARARADLEARSVRETKAMQAEEASEVERFRKRVLQRLPGFARRIRAGLVVAADGVLFLDGGADCTAGLLPERGGCAPVPGSRVGVARFDVLAGDVRTEEQQRVAIARLRKPLSGVARRRGLDIVLANSVAVYAAPEADITADAEKAIE